MPSAGDAPALWDGRRFTGVAAALFDLDGTLVETRIDFDGMRRAVGELAARLGVPAAALEGLDILERVAHLAEASTEPGRVRAEAEAALTAIELDACQSACEMPGATALLRGLMERGIRVGIVTRNCRRAVSEILARVPLPHEILLSRNEVPRVKPDPAHLLQAAASLGADPRSTVMVGDHVMDVRGGRAAGMGTVGFLTPDRPLDFFAREAPDLVIRDLRELLAWISPSSS